MNNISPMQSRCKIALIVGVILLSLFILQPFFSAIVWGTILSITFFPLYKKLEAKCSPMLASSLTIVGIVAIVVLPLSYLLSTAGQEIPDMINIYKGVQSNGISIPHQIDKFPKIHNFLQHWIDAHPMKNNNFENVGHFALDYIVKATHKIGEISEAIGIALMTTFFILLYNETLIQQMKNVSHHLIGQDGEDLSYKAITAVRGAVSGLVLVGLGEGVLCMPILFIAHIPHAALLAISIGIAAIIPFCAPIVLSLVCIYAFFVVSLKAVIIAGVGAMIILFLGDHFVRPKLIGSANKLPFMVVMLSILGGLHAFGILGLFVGPAVFTIAMTLWKAIAEKKDM